MTPYQTIEAGTLLLPRDELHDDCHVIVRAYGRYRWAKVQRYGDRFAVVAFKTRSAGRIVERSYPRTSLYEIAPGFPVADLVRLKCVRVYETVTNLAYDKTRKGPHRIVKLQAV
jgi:hypothetical protein